MRAILVLALGVALASPVNGQSRLEKQIDALVARPPSTLRPLMQFKGDDLDTRLTITTEGVSQIVSKGLIASTTNENSFLRAFIEKKDGSVSAQIYHRVIDGGRVAPGISRASYEGVSGPVDAEALRIGFDVSCARYGCVYYEDVAIPIDFPALKAAAAKYDPSTPRNALRYRLYGRSGKNYDEAIPLNEVVVFVSVVEERAKEFAKPR